MIRINVADIQQQIAAASAVSLEAVGETGPSTVYVGDGQGNTRPNVLLNPRDVLYRNTLDQAVPGVAPLSPDANIPLDDLIDNPTAYDGLECTLAYAPGATEPSILHITLAGNYATGGRSPAEQAQRVAATPTQDKIATFRGQPTDPVSTFSQILASPPMAYRDGLTLGYFETSLVSAAAAIAALTSGQHQLAIAYIPRSTGVPALALSTATTAVGTLPSRSEFSAADVSAITLAAGVYVSTVLYLYYGQTALELADHLYQYDPRQVFEAMDSAPVTAVTASAPLASSGGTTPDISLTGSIPAANIPTAPRTLFDHYADVGNSGTSETDLYSDTIAVNTLTANGQKLMAVYSFKFVSSATATRQVRLYFAGTLLLDTGLLSVSVASSGEARVTLIRSGTTTARVSVALQTSSAALVAYAQETDLTGLDFTATNILKITGTAAGSGAASNDILAKLSSVQWLPAA